jgi:hypothetical protein
MEVATIDAVTTMNNESVSFKHILEADEASSHRSVFASEMKESSRPTSIMKKP